MHINPTTQHTMGTHSDVVCTKTQIAGSVNRLSYAESMHAITMCTVCLYSNSGNKYSSCRLFWLKKHASPKKKRLFLS